MRGIPVRVEMGPRDIEANQAVIVRRDTREKITVSIDELADRIPEILDTIQKDMLERARAHREAHTYTALNYVHRYSGEEAGIHQGYVVWRPGL